MDGTTKVSPRILALDVGRTVIKSALFDSDGRRVDSRKTPSAGLYAQDLVARAVDVARQYERFDVIGVAISGQIDTNTQSALFEYRKGNILKGKAVERPVGAVFRQALSTDVFVLNDSTAAALGEAKFGAGKGTEDFICLTYGTGVGGGVIVGGKVYEGRRGIAGEMGHMVIHRGGRLCGCGNRGCYEQYASVTALIQSAQMITPEVQNGIELFYAAQSEPRLKRVIRAWADEVIAGLETLTYIFNPSLIVLGGGVLERPEVLEIIRQRFYRHVIPTFAQVELRAAEQGNQAGLYGAYAYAIQSTNM